MKKHRHREKKNEKIKKEIIIVVIALVFSIAAGALLSFIFSWNEMMFALILGGSGAKTLPAAFTGLVTPHGTFWGQLCAAAFVVTLPIIILAAFLQKYLIRGLSMGAVKG